MATNYREILRREGRKLAARAELSLDHPTARGDGREALVRKFLRRRIGSSFGVAKAEVIDSKGRTTGEFDAVIYDKRTAAAVAIEAGRKAVRVEAVAATIEVKSELKSAHLDEVFQRSNKDLLQLTRFYEPSMLLRAVGPTAPDWAKTETLLHEGLNAMLHHQNIPEVVSFVFGFGGVSKETTIPQLQLLGVDVICVLGSYVVAKQNIGFSGNPPALELWAEGEDALGAFLFLVERCLDNYLDSTRWVSPLWRRYFFSPEVVKAERTPTA
jgi:hypothetical protein